MPDSRENGDQSQGGADLFYFCTYIDLHWLTMLWKRAGLPHSAQCCNDRSTLGHPGQHRPTQWLCNICMSTLIQKLERVAPPWLWSPFSREPGISPLPAFTSSLLGPRRMFGASLDEIDLVSTFHGQICLLLCVTKNTTGWATCALARGLTKWVLLNATGRRKVSLSRHVCVPKHSNKLNRAHLI